MKQIALEPIYDKVMPLMPTGHNLALEQGAFLVTLESIEIPDRLQNSHIKILRGTYDRIVPSRIRVRDHYPHMAGSAWGLSDINMYGYWINSAPLVTSTEYSKGSSYPDPRGFTVHNMALDKETTFWCARDDEVEVSGETQPYSMRYFTGDGDIEPGDFPNYYDDTLPPGTYPYGEDPSGWVNATIDTENKTWEATIELKQFWIRSDATEKLDMQNNSWGRDPRLHFIELQVQRDNDGGVIDTGTRVIYNWHVPLSMGNVAAPTVEYVAGVWTMPSSVGACILGPGFWGCHYHIGFFASGGLLRMNFEDISLVYIEKTFNPHQTFYVNYARNPDRISIDYEAQDITQIISIVASTVYESISYSYTYDLGQVSLENGFIVSPEFSRQRIPGWDALPSDEYIAITLTIRMEVSNHLYGNSAICHTRQTPGSTVGRSWCTKSPLCAQVCLGSTTLNIALSKWEMDDTLITENWSVGAKTIYFSLDKQFGQQDDSATAYYWGIAGGISPSALCLASDGGKTRYWIPLTYMSTPTAEQGAVNRLPEFGDREIVSQSTLNNELAINYPVGLGVFTFSKRFVLFLGSETLIDDEWMLNWSGGLKLKRDGVEVV